jgi:hypothetical protein
MTCTICDGELRPHARKRTCDNCSAWFHRWYKRDANDVHDYSLKLRKANTRIRSFATIEGDDTTIKPQVALIKSGLMMASTKRARANVIAIKTAAARRKRA